MNRLTTFMHISDLHFGTLDPLSLNATNSWWMKFPILDGYLGHSERALFALDRRFAALKNEHARLIITGDLTTCGKDVEFQLFDTYAGANPSSNSLNYMGLRNPGWQTTAIPGNHDYWPGTLTILGSPPGMVYSIFKDLPRISPLLHIGQGYQVRFIWINSDAEVGHKSKHRGFAQGRCVLHLKDLRTKMPALVDKEIRVLCMHHSPAYKGSAPLRLLEMDKTSRDRLAQFIIDYRISVVLCGHLHSPPYVHPELAVSGTKKALFLEARCGSTSQIKPSDLLSPVKSKLRSLGLLPKERTNTLLVHRVIERNGRVDWETEINLLYPGKFDKSTSSELDNGQKVTVRFRVWPP